MMRLHNVVVRMTTHAQNNWVSELVSQMTNTATNHALEEYKRLKAEEIKWKYRDDTDVAKVTGTNIQKEDDSKAINVCTSIKKEDDDQVRYAASNHKVARLTLDEIANAGKSNFNED